MFGIAVRFNLLDEEAARRFDELAAEALVGIKEREPGTLVYAVHTVEDEPLARIFYELYEGRDAHLQHEANPTTQVLLSQVKSLTSSVRAEFLGAPVGKVF